MTVTCGWRQTNKMAGQTYNFTPSCCRLVTFGDLLQHMSPEERALWPLRPEGTLKAKLIWSKEACEMIHPEAHNQGTPYWPVGAEIASTGVQVGTAVSLAPWAADLDDIEIINVDDALMQGQATTTTMEGCITSGQTEILPVRGQQAVEQREGGLEALGTDSETETEISDGESGTEAGR